MTATATVKRREDAALNAAALTRGPAELLDFLIPLWAGIALGASATQVGLLVAAETAVSFLVRPVAGVLADRRDRRRLAAVGALLYGLACAGYALAGSVDVALVAAVLGGAGGALLWVPVRAMVGERLGEDSSVFARLTSAEADGTWIAYLVGIGGLSLLDYDGVFLVCAAACGVAAAVLASAPAGDRREARAMSALPATGGLRRLSRRLRPMLAAVAVTELAEAGIAVLLLLHLQRDFGLEIGQIAGVFIPGAIALAILPPYMHKLVLRVGRVPVLAGASVASALFAAGLAWAPSPTVIAGLWVLAAAAWAAVQPIQQSVVTEAAAGHEGQGMGLYESAALAGTAVGGLAAGLLFDLGSWEIACLSFAAVILAGAAIVPVAVRRLAIADIS